MKPAIVLAIIAIAIIGVRQFQTSAPTPPAEPSPIRSSGESSGSSRVSQSEEANESESPFDLQRNPSQSPTGHWVEGARNLIRSPFALDGPYIDINGIDPGTMIECPITGKSFRVPEPTADELAIRDHEEKLANTILPAFRLDAQTLEQPEWLFGLSDLPIAIDQASIRKYDPNALKTPLTFDLQNVPLSETLRFVSSLSKVPHEVTPEGVVFRLHEAPPPPKPPSPNLYTKTYKRPEHLPRPASGGTLMDHLREQGIEFPEDSSVFYHKAKDQIVVRNSREQMARLDVFMNPDASR